MLKNGSIKTRQAPRWELSTVQGSPGDYGDAGQKGYPGVSTAARPKVSVSERLPLKEKWILIHCFLYFKSINMNYGQATEGKVCKFGIYSNPGLLGDIETSCFRLVHRERRDDQVTLVRWVFLV